MTLCYDCRSQAPMPRIFMVNQSPNPTLLLPRCIIQTVHSTIQHLLVQDIWEASNPISLASAPLYPSVAHTDIGVNYEKHKAFSFQNLHQELMTASGYMAQTFQAWNSVSFKYDSKITFLTEVTWPLHKPFCSRLNQKLFPLPWLTLCFVILLHFIFVSIPLESTAWCE